MRDRHDHRLFVDSIADLLHIDMNAVVALYQMDFRSVLLPAMPDVADGGEVEFGKDDFIAFAGEIQTACDQRAAYSQVVDECDIARICTDDLAEEIGNRIDKRKPGVPALHAFGLPFMRVMHKLALDFTRHGAERIR